MAEVLKLTPEKGAVVPINEDPTDGGRAYDYTPGYLGQQVVDVSTGSVYVATGVTPSNWLLTAVGTGAVDSVFGRTGVVAAANGDYAGVVASHLTGATAATRYVGGTASGSPGSGAFLLGDFVIDQTGKVWVCTVAGSPGTWTQAGAGAGSISVTDGSTTVDPATSIDFSGATVTDEGGGVAGVAVGGSQPIQTVTIPLAYNTPDLILTGIPTGYVQVVGAIVVASTVVLLNNPVWDGATPTVHLGYAGALTDLDALVANTSLAAAPGGGLHSLAPSAIYNPPVVFTDVAPIYVMVDDGAGGDPGSMAGASVLTLYISAP